MCKTKGLDGFDSFGELASFSKLGSTSDFRIIYGRWRAAVDVFLSSPVKLRLVGNGLKPERRKITIFPCLESLMEK
jgi:hypothetical protein